MKRIFHPLLVLLALLLIAEEWLWDRLKASMRSIARLLHLQRLEAGLRTLPPWPSLAVMLLPGIVLFPFKMLALWALSNGYPIVGALAFVGAKLAGTALAAYLFELVRDNARKLAWFDRTYSFVMHWIAKAKAWLNSFAAVQACRAKVAELKHAWRSALVTETRSSSRWVKKWQAAKAVARRKA